MHPGSRKMGSNYSKHKMGRTKNSHPPIRAKLIEFFARSDRMGPNVFKIEIGNYKLLNKRRDSQMQHTQTFRIKIEGMSLE